MTLQRKILLTGILMASVISTISAHADIGPVVLGHPQRPPILTLDPIAGSFGLLTLLETDSSTSHNASTTSTSALIEQNATLATGGSVVSPNFFTWHGSATLGINEEWSRTPTENTTGFGFAHAYDFTGTFLPATIIPAQIYARRTENYVSRTFQPLTKDTFSEYGAHIDYQSPKIPTSFVVSHTETTQSAISGQKDFTLAEDHLSLESAYEPIEHHHLTFNYQYTLVDQNNPGVLSGQSSPTGFSNSYQSQSVGVGHFWQIDNSGQYTLSQNLNYSTEDGSFPFTHLSLGEDLHMRHTSQFETDLRYTFDHQDYLSTSSESQQILASFDYRLFESLSTHGQAGANFTSNSFGTSQLAQSSNSETKSYFTNLSLNYTKHVPYGVLGANLAVGYNETDNGAIGSTQSVLNDLQTFNDPQPIIITRQNVNPNSVALFNASGTRRYVRNVNYTVRQVGNTLQIDRSFASNIAPGDTVRLNYDVDPLPGYTAQTTNFGTGLRYDFTEGPLNGLGLFGQFSKSDQSISSSLVRADNVTDTVFGADYRIWKLTLRADREDRQSTLAPFDATRFSAIYTNRISQRSAFSIGATQAFIDYPSTGGHTDLTTIDGHADYQISREIKAIASARWRNDQDSRFGNTMGFEEQGELQWTLRQTHFFFLIRHTDVEATANSTDSFSAQFGLTRSF